jgi:hypothetical protein
MRMKLVFLLSAPVLLCAALSFSVSARAGESPSKETALATWVDVTLEEEGEKDVDLRSRVTGPGEGA